MKIIEVPIFNPDGSVAVTVNISPEESLALLQFALNFLASAGHVAYHSMNKKEEGPTQLEIFPPHTLN